MIIGVSGYQPIRSPHVLTHTNIFSGISHEILVHPHILMIQIHTTFHITYYQSKQSSIALTISHYLI